MISRIIRYKMEDLFYLKHISLGRNGFLSLSNYLCSLTNQWKTENTPLALCHKIQWKFTSAIDVIFFQSLKNKVFVNWKCFGLRGYFRPMACSCQDHMTELPFLFLLQRHLSFYCNSWWMCHLPLLLNLLFFKGSKRGSKTGWTNHFNRCSKKLTLVQRFLNRPRPISRMVQKCIWCSFQTA